MLVDRLHDPLQAHPLVIMLAVIGILLGLLVVTWPLFSRLLKGRELDFSVPQHVRSEYEGKIAEVAQQLDDGDITPRTAAQKLGELVRHFTRDAWGHKVEHMTLHELKSTGLTPVADTIDALYEAEFSATDPTDVEPHFERTRKLVGMWS